MKKTKKEFMLTATIYKTAYIEAKNEQEAREKLFNQLISELDDTYHIDIIENVENN